MLQKKPIEGLLLRVSASTMRCNLIKCLLIQFAHLAPLFLTSGRYFAQKLHGLPREVSAAKLLYRLQTAIIESQQKRKLRKMLRRVGSMRKESVPIDQPER